MQFLRGMIPYLCTRLLIPKMRSRGNSEEGAVDPAGRDLFVSRANDNG